MIKKVISLDRSILFRCVHFYFLNQAERDFTIPRNKIKTILGKGLHIPKDQRNKLLKELEDVGIITASHREWIKVNEKNPFETIY